MNYEKVLGEHKFPTYEELKTGLIRLIDEGKISREDAARLLPELRESEDERIRKAVVSLVYEMKGTYQSFAKVELDQMVAWLEKQKEQKPAEWSEEDEDMLNSCISSIEEAKENRYAYRETDGDTSYDHEISWLKSIRPQPQGTYKLIVHNIYEMLKDKDFFDITPSHRVSLLNDIRVKCKDADECAEILDVPSWKPSEEQMKALEVAFRKDGDDNYRNAINSLYNDLKKL